jgi:hypothetical protein
MKRVAILALVVVLAACGSDSSGPTNKFSGTWTGKALAGPTDTLNFVFVAGQNGSTVSGTGNISADGTTLADVFSGTSAPPSVALTILVGPNTLTYSGSYVSSDSIAGVLSEAGTSLTLDLVKH